LIFVSCEEPGKTKIKVRGDEPGLPEDLKGLKIYSVSDGERNVRVAILKGSVVGTNIKDGKQYHNTVNVYEENVTTRTFLPEDIIIENDSIVVIRK
jgi:hypothetical protein